MVVRRCRAPVPSAGAGGGRPPVWAAAARGGPASVTAVPGAGVTVVAVAVVIPALDETERVAATVAAARGIPGITRVVVVDDGSTDDTAALAAAAGALVVRHPRRRGKAAALETGADLVPEAELLLLLDADLGASAAGAGALVGPVLDGSVDATVGVLSPQHSADGSPAGGLGLVVGLARVGIARATGFRPVAPLSGQRCLTRAAFDAVRPLAPGFGVETRMTIDLLRLGFRLREVPVPLTHRATGDDTAGRRHRARQLVDVAAALGQDRTRRTRRGPR